MMNAPTIGNGAVAAGNHTRPEDIVARALAASLAENARLIVALEAERMARARAEMALKETSANSTAKKTARRPGEPKQSK